ncbi:Son of sevenless 1 [Balamuthia mandrillaris]
MAAAVKNLKQEETKERSRTLSTEWTWAPLRLLENINTLHKQATRDLLTKEEILFRISDLHKEELQDRVVELELANQSLLLRFTSLGEHVYRLSSTVTQLKAQIESLLNERQSLQNSQQTTPLTPTSSGSFPSVSSSSSTPLSSSPPFSPAILPSNNNSNNTSRPSSPLIAAQWSTPTRSTPSSSTSSTSSPFASFKTEEKWLASNKLSSTSDSGESFSSSALPPSSFAPSLSPSSSSASLSLLQDAPPTSLFNTEAVSIGQRRSSSDKNKEKKCRQSLVKVGQESMLLDFLLLESAPVPQFIIDYINTYPCFTNASTLLDVLSSKFKRAAGKDEALCVRIANIVRTWVALNGSIFVTDRSMEQQLLQFLNTTMSQAGMSILATSIKDAFLLLKSEANKMEGYPSFPSLTLTPPNKDWILTATPVELARQLTLLQHALFKKITSNDLLGYLRLLNSPSSSPTTPTNLSASTSALSSSFMKAKASFSSSTGNHNTFGPTHTLSSLTASRNATTYFARMVQVSKALRGWVADEVNGNNDKCSVDVFHHLCLVAHECAELNNFMAVFDIMAGLQDGLKDRFDEFVKLCKLKGTLGDSSRKKSVGFTTIFTSIGRLIDKNQNYLAYQTAVNRCFPPCIPWIETFRVQMEKLEKKPNETSQKHINLEKHHKLSQLVEELRQYQRGMYDTIALHPQLFNSWRNVLKI